MKTKSLLLAFAPVVLASAFSSAMAAEPENKPEAGEAIQTQAPALTLEGAKAAARGRAAIFVCPDRPPLPEQGRLWPQPARIGYSANSLRQTHAGFHN